MDLTRRDLLRTGVSAAALAAIPRPMLAHVGARPEPVPPIVDPDVKELALRAVDAARRAGAVYADVRLTHTKARTAMPGGFADDREQMVVGTRALVDGYWGFASGPVWTKDEMDRLGQEAVHQAKANAFGKSRVIELASTPVVRDGHWVTPVENDPFEVSPFEILDFLNSLTLFVGERFKRFSDVQASLFVYQFQLQEKAFASSEGSFCTQRLYLSEGSFRVICGPLVATPDVLTAAGTGWELFKGPLLRNQIEQLAEELLEESRLPVRRVEPGRFDTVCDARTVAEFADSTLGPATELDRAIGYEANATGTSYINDPSGMMGTYEAGAPTLTLTGNRSERGGAATVQWDDEGVRPDESTIVKNGVLTDFQTTRESATWLADRYAAQVVPVRSHGYANAPTALEVPLQHSPNLRLAPGKEALDFKTLIAGMDKGIAVKRVGGISMDFRALNGFVVAPASTFRVSQGKVVARIAGAGILFRSPDVWKGVAALGGEGSERRYGLFRSKGEPVQETVHSVTAPPAIFKQLTFIEAGRK